MIINPYVFGGGSLLLDLYPSAAVAYSLRKLRTAYTGNAIRVRRSSDNTEQDIAFSGNDLDTSSLTTFCSGTNGFITTWYDQSGNINNATQITAASQAQIVSSGSVITDPNTGKISVTWTSDDYSPSSIATTQNMLMMAVVNRTSTSGLLLPIGSTSASGRLFAWGSTGNIVSQIASTAVTHETGFTTTGAQIISALRDSSDIVKAWRNTTALTTGTSAGSSNFIRFGRVSSSYTLGRMVEMILWLNDKESSRSDIQTNVNNYWTVY